MSGDDWFLDDNELGVELARVKREITDAPSWNVVSNNFRNTPATAIDLDKAAAKKVATDVFGALRQGQKEHQGKRYDERQEALRPPKRTRTKIPGEATGSVPKNPKRRSGVGPSTVATSASIGLMSEEEFDRGYRSIAADAQRDIVFPVANNSNNQGGVIRSIGNNIPRYLYFMQNK